MHKIALGKQFVKFVIIYYHRHKQLVISTEEAWKHGACACMEAL